MKPGVVLPAAGAIVAPLTTGAVMSAVTLKVAVAVLLALSVALTV